MSDQKGPTGYEGLIESEVLRHILERLDEMLTVMQGTASMLSTFLAEWEAANVVPPT